jgi:GMP synthase-like glutamine amidotransferase
LQDAIAKQVTGECPGDQLIDQPAGGDQEDGKKKDYGHENPGVRRQESE